MNRFSANSMAQLDTCDPRLRGLFKRVLIFADCTIIEGRRSEDRQNEMVRTGKSKLPWPQSAHNVTEKGGLSRAVDVAPYFPGGIPWDDQRAFDFFAGIVFGIADTEGTKLIWGGNWAGDRRPGKGQSFHDLPHFQLKD